MLICLGDIQDYYDLHWICWNTELIEHYKIITMADIPKTSIFSGLTGNTNPVAQGKPVEQSQTTSLFPPPNPTSNPPGQPPKQPNSMLSSITVPMTLNTKSTASFQQNEPKEQKKGNPQPQPIKVGAPDDKNKGQGQKTGGTLSGPPQTSAVRTNAQQANLREREKIQRQTLVLSTLMDKLFFRKIIENNAPANDNDIKAFVEIFGKLCASEKERQESLKKLKDPNERRKILLIKYLKNEKDEKTLDKIHEDFCVIIKRILEKCSYISVEACVFLIEQYITLNEAIYYPDGKFLHNELKEANSNFQTSPRLNNIIRQIETIQENIFVKYQHTLQMLVLKSRNKAKEPSAFLEKLLKNQQLLRKLGHEIWNSFEIILIAQKRKQKRAKFLNYSFELNIFLNCLNLYNQFIPNYFNKEITTSRILPVLRDSLYLFQGQSSVTINSIDRLILTLLLVHPYTVANWQSVPALKQFLLDDMIRQRYHYLCLLFEDNINPGQLTPLAGCETVIFLQNYIKMNENMEGYQPSKHAFIFNSICQIFKTNPSYNIINRNLYPKVYSYIDYITSSILQQSIEDISERDYYYGCNPKYLAACRLSKLISSLCLSTKGQSINTYRFSELIKKDSQIVTQLLVICFEIVELQGKDNEQCNFQLQSFEITTQEVYGLIFRLIIYNGRYFQSRLGLIESFFETVHNFYVRVIISYVTKFIEQANYIHLHLFALAQLVSTTGYYSICKEIFDELSSLKDHNVQLENQFQKRFQKTQLQYAVQQVLTLKPDKPNAFPAVAHLLLSVLHYNPVFLQSQWLSALTSQIKRLIETNHPIVLTRYAQTLIEVLCYLSRNNAHLRQVQSHFQFRFINVFLCHVLSFQFERDNPKVCNKMMRSRQYNLVKIGIRLIKEMTSLYLKEKEGGQERVPLQVKRVLQLENKGGHYQLLLTKEATSYNVALIIVLLSREFVLDHYLRKKEPNFRDNIFEALTNLNLISNLLKYDINLKIHHLYNRHSEIQINEGLYLKSSVLDQIKWSPSYASLEYMMSWNQFKIDLKKELFEKVKDLQSIDKVHNLQTKAHFLQVYWKNIACKHLRIGYEEAWAYTDSFLKSFDLRSQEVDLSQHPEIAQQISSNIFKLSIFIKRTCLRTYSQFLLSYNKYFLQYMKQAESLQDFQGSLLSDHFHEAIVCFFNIRAILTPSLFDPFTKEAILPSNLFLFLVEVLQRRYKMKHNDQKKDRETLMQIIMYGVGFLLDIAANNSELDKWLADILKFVIKADPVPGQLSTKKILLIIILHAKLQKSLDYFDLDFTNHHWLLLTNVLESSQKLSEVLLLDFPYIYNSHPIYFVSTCHYFLKAAKTQNLSWLTQTNNLSLHKTFLDSIMAIFHKTIKEAKSYYSVWIVEILSEIVANEIINKHQSQRYYEEIRKIILESQVLHERIGLLLGKVAAAVGFDLKDLRGCWKYTGKLEKFISLSEKIQLISYFRLLTIIYFSPKHKLLATSKQRNGYSQSASLLQKEQNIFLSITSMLPLLIKLMNSNSGQLEVTTQVEEHLSKIYLDVFQSKGLKQSVMRQQIKIQIHQIWPRDTSALDLVNYVSSYELVSICAVWLGDIVNANADKFSIHHQILKRDIFDRTINNLIMLMDEVAKVLEPYEKSKEIIGPLLQRYSTTIYSSITVSKEMQFTNTSSLGSYLSFEFQDISKQLSQIVVGVHKIIKKVFEEARKGAIKLKAEGNFRAKERNLRTIERMLKNVDIRFFETFDKSTHRNDSEYLSRNLTRTFF